MILTNPKTIIIYSSVSLLIFVLIFWLFGIIYALAYLVFLLCLFFHRFIIILGILGITFLIAGVILTIFHQVTIAEQMALYAYFSLVIMIILQIIRYFKTPPSDDFAENEHQEEKINNYQATPSLEYYDYLKPTREVTKGSNFWYQIVIFPLLVILLSLILLFFLGPRIQPALTNLYFKKEIVPSEKFAVSIASHNIDQQEGQAASGKETYKIRVENGSGKSGDAKKAADLVISKGYRVLTADIITSEKQDYLITEIHCKQGAEVAAKTLADDLSKNSFKIIADIKTISAYNFVIIVGKND